MKGRIVCWFQNRGFGFIRTADDTEYFFHISNCKDKIALSMKVEFEVGPPVKEGKGPQALNITATPVERKGEGGGQ